MTTKSSGILPGRLDNPQSPETRRCCPTGDREIKSPGDAPRRFQETREVPDKSPVQIRITLFVPDFANPAPWFAKATAVAMPAYPPTVLRLFPKKSEQLSRLPQRASQSASQPGQLKQVRAPKAAGISTRMMTT